MEENKEKNGNIQESKTKRKDLKYKQQLQNSEIVRMLEASEMIVLRRIANKTLLDRVATEEIRNISKINEANEWLKRKKWSNYIRRMSEDGVVRIARITKGKEQ